MNPQQNYNIYRQNDPCSPRRLTTAFETRILQSVVDKVALIFRVPRIERLVAISLKRDTPSELIWQSPEDVVVSEEDIVFARKALEGLPRVELVEGLETEARVIRSTNSTDEPASYRPARIQLRAEVRTRLRFALVATDAFEQRAYVLWTLAALSSEQNLTPWYRQAQVWAIWVLTHEMMHWVRERVRTSFTPQLAVNVRE